MEAPEDKVMVHIGMDAKLRAQARKKAAQFGLTLSEYFRIILRNSVDGHDELVVRSPKKRSA